jgi:exopolyphosphatase
VHEVNTTLSDLDSIASSIAFAWIQSEVHKKPTMPLIQIQRDDFGLREENLYALNLAGVDNPREQLLSLSDLEAIKPFPSRRFALVDHNHISTSFTIDNPAAQVVAVIDHHDDQGLYKDTANPRTISPAGSCSSHIASLCPSEVPAEIATLLLCAILIDTDGLKPGGKALQVDYDAAGFLASKSTFAPSLPPKLLNSLLDDPKSKTDAVYEAPAIKDLAGILSAKKSDLAHLSGWDLLRRDYKESEYILSWAPNQPSIKGGLSTVPVGLEKWGMDGKLEEAAAAWMKDRGLTVFGALTSFRDGSTPGKSGRGKHRREMAWFIREDIEEMTNGQSGGNGEVHKRLNYDDLAARLWKGLEDNAEIKVKKHKKISLEKGGKLPQGMRVRVYDQRNADVTRKGIAPLLKNILESPTIAAVPNKSEKK